jgi:hypothetical protein
VPGFLLFNGVSIFRSFLNNLNSFDMKATIDTVNQTATSTKVFDVVFQPLLYGYLDLEEINNKSTVRQNSIAVLADGLVLADRIEATSVIALMQEELHDKYASASLSVAAIKKLFRARPMTTDFLTHYMSRLSSIPRDTEILQSVREQVEGFAEFELACRKKFDELRAIAKEQVTVPTVNQEVDLKTNAEEPGQTPRVEVEDTDPTMGKEVDMQAIDQELVQTPLVEVQVLGEEESTVKQGKRPLRDHSPAFPANKRHKEDDAVSDTTAVPSTPRLAPTADSTVGLSTPSAQILKDLSAAAPPPLTTIAETPSAAAAPKVAKGKARAKTSSGRRETAKPRGKKKAAPAVVPISTEAADTTVSDPIITPPFAQTLLSAREVPVESDEAGPDHQAEHSDFSHENGSAQPSAAISSTTASPVAGAARLTDLATPKAPEVAMPGPKIENTAVSKSAAKPKTEVKSKTSKATSSTTPKATTRAKATIKTRTRAAPGAASNPVPVLVSKTATPPSSDPKPKAVARTKAGTKPKLTLKLGAAAEPEPATDAEPGFEQQSLPQTEPTLKPESVPTVKTKANAQAIPKVAAPAPAPLPNAAPAPSKPPPAPKRPATRSRKATAPTTELPATEDELPLPGEKAPVNAVTTNAKPGAKRGRKKAASPPPPSQPAVIVPKTANGDGEGAVEVRNDTASNATMSAVDDTARSAIHGAIFDEDAVAAGLQKTAEDTAIAAESQKGHVTSAAKAAESKTGPDKATPKAPTRATRKGLVDRKGAVTAAIRAPPKAAPEATPKAAVTQSAVEGATKAAPKASSAAKGKVKRNATKGKTTIKKTAITVATEDDEGEDEGEGEVETARPRRAAATKAGKYIS